MENHMHSNTPHFKCASLSHKIEQFSRKKLAGLICHFWEDKKINYNWENYKDNMNKVRIQQKSKKSQEELIQQNFPDSLVLSTLNALYTLAAISAKSLTAATNENTKHITKIITFLFSIDICFSSTFSTLDLQSDYIHYQPPL